MPSSWRPHARSACSTSSGIPNSDAARAWLEQAGHTLVPRGSPLYPERLAAIADPPPALWVDGQDLALLSEPQLAIVGSRHASRNGEITAESFALEIGRLGLVITSGLAAGIDAAAHRGALDGGGHTIAVTGGGIDCIYPARNRRLADAIRAQGLIVSEYPPGHPVRAFQFPLRNRIIAGLCLGTLVVEATRRSGSLITARLAAEYGREVFAVPGSIHHAQSKGCHKLLRDGAKLVENINDILVEIAPQLASVTASGNREQGPVRTETLPAPLAKILDYSPIGFDALVAATGLTAAELSSMLLHQEILGTIEALPGGRYCRLAERAG